MATTAALMKKESRIGGIGSTDERRIAELMCVG